MSNTIQDKLDKLLQIKTDIRNAVNQFGSTGETLIADDAKFDTYSTAISSYLARRTEITPQVLSWDTPSNYTIKVDDVESTTASSKIVNSGTIVNIECVPIDEHQFDEWSGTGYPLGTNTESNPLTFVMPNNAVTGIKATTSVKTYTLSWEAPDYGQLKVTVGTTDYSSVTSATVEMGVTIKFEYIMDDTNPKYVYEWINIPNGANYDAFNLTFTMPNQDVNNIEASLLNAYYMTKTINISNAGTISVDSGIITKGSREYYRAGTLVKLTANPATNYKFSKFIINDEEYTSSTISDLNIDGNKTVTCYFQQLSNTLQVIANTTTTPICRVTLKIDDTQYDPFEDNATHTYTGLSSDTAITTIGEVIDATQYEFSGWTVKTGDTQTTVTGTVYSTETMSNNMSIIANYNVKAKTGSYYYSTNTTTEPPYDASCFTTTDKTIKFTSSNVLQVRTYVLTETDKEFTLKSNGSDVSTLKMTLLSDIKDIVKEYVKEGFDGYKCYKLTTTEEEEPAAEQIEEYNTSLIITIKD